MNRFLYLIAAVLAVAIAGPAAASAPSSLDPANSALYKRMVALNGNVSSYEADVHLDVALRTFPFISPSLDGNVYYKRPDKEVVVFNTVPALAAQFKKVYPRLDPPDQWTSLYTVTKLGDADGATTFRLVPKKDGRVQHLDVKVDDASAAPSSYTWTYKDGGFVTFEQSYTHENGAYLLHKQTGRVELPTYKADVTSNFSNYRLNVAVADSVFEDK
ncbi:MAG: hypothetical protein M3R44_04520 [Candidatus Eremiobacteraeota bacterium]|nr:hypothetical protein [Candidatus Eremiobacteraeota bacterium]